MLVTDFTEKIRKYVNNQNLVDNLKWFSEVRRDTGGPGEQATVDYIVECLKKCDVPVQVHKFQAYLSYPRNATLEVLEPEHLSLPCLTHSFCASTDNLVDELIYLQDGDVTKATNAAALVDGLLSPLKVLEASKSGARALIFANEGHVIHNMIGTTIWGTPTLDQIERLPTIPVISINHESGQKLKHLLNQGAVVVRITTEVETGWVESLLPEATIQGGEESDDFVLVGGHYCAWEVGVTDNATGDVVLLEMARIMKQLQSELRRSVKICWWPGHSHGRYSGSTWYADNFYENLLHHCIAYHNIDSPGVKGATHYVARHTTSEIQSFCQGVIADMTGQTDCPVHRPSRAADQSFVAMGVPSFSCYPLLPEDHPDHRAWTGGCANAWWWHSSDDTLDKADLDVLSKDTLISTMAVATMCTMPIIPLNISDAANEVYRIAVEFENAGKERISANRFRQQAERFVAVAESFMKEANLPTNLDKAAEINQALIGVTRILNPILYSKQGQFQHDPADKTPVMRNLKSSLFPGLTRVSELPLLDGTREYGFLRTQLQRELNRVTVTLDVLNDYCQINIGSLQA